MVFSVLLRSSKLNFDFQLLSVEFFSEKFRVSFKYLDIFQILACHCCWVSSCVL